MPDPRVLVYSRPGCHLCETALETVSRVCAELGETWGEVDITDDPELVAAYTDEVPVTLVDGERHDFWRVDEARLRHALTSRR